ncbi:MAG: acetyl-CoA carboxylase carboxyl transferase subunit alpha/beta [Desulfovibrionaceae bacterium]
MENVKKLQELSSRLEYIKDIFLEERQGTIIVLEKTYQEVKNLVDISAPDVKAYLERADQIFTTTERQLDEVLSAMNKVRIVRHSQRVCLRDILENVYDNYTEIGGKDECSIDPGVLIARAYITRKRGSKYINQAVMVIGHEKGHGEEYRNGGSAKPFGNAKALHYMNVAETEGIPIHTYVFTPGAYPIEDTPGAGQQIAKNLYEMSNLTVPVISIFSEGGSGGAEAVSLADVRLMLSHGYYSVISPEGAAAIEGRVKPGERVSQEIIEQCANNLCMGAQDNLRMGYIDRIINEPSLGAKPYHYDFFKRLRQEVIRATDEVLLSVRVLSPLRTRVVQKEGSEIELDSFSITWEMSKREKHRLVKRRHKKFRKMSQHTGVDRRTLYTRVQSYFQQRWWDIYSYFTYRIIRAQKRKLTTVFEEVEAEVSALSHGISVPVKRLFRNNPSTEDAQNSLTRLSTWDSSTARGEWRYVSPKAKEDRAVSCPNSEECGCLDMWARDLYGEFAGVCMYCGHHFPMEYEWCYNNLFDDGSILEFNKQIVAGNPLSFPNFDAKLSQAKEKTNQNSSCITFEARVDSIKVVVAMLIAPFRGGSVGSAEGEKFIRAAELAKRKHQPFIAYVHGTAGIRIQEGVNGVIQMPRCTMAVRRYIDAGGLYLVVYDTNSYAGPLASFLGCSPYQFGIRSSNIGFAGRGVIKETIGMDIPPDYHGVYKALSRGHIQGVWDRRETRNNIRQALYTMGGNSLYYR